MNTQYKKPIVMALLLAASMLLVACQQGTPTTTGEGTAAQTEATAPQVTPAPAPADEAIPAVEQLVSEPNNAPDVLPPVAPVPPAAPAKPVAPSSATKPAPKPASDPYAQVISVTPVRRSIDNPKEVCRDVEVVYNVAPKDENKVAGTAIGAVAGAVIGSQIGKGHGRDAARIAGAVGGAVAGRKIQENQQSKRTETRIERQCETVNDTTYEIIGYDIIYSYDGKSHEARVAEDPGPRIKLPVRSIDP